jgi:hypothetical protein
MVKDLFYGFAGLQKWVLKMKAQGRILRLPSGALRTNEEADDLIQVVPEGNYCGCGAVALPEYDWVQVLPMSTAVISGKTRQIIIHISTPKIDAGSLSQILLVSRIRSTDAMATILNKGVFQIHRVEKLEDGTPAAYSKKPFITIPIQLQQSQGQPNQKNKMEG